MDYSKVLNRTLASLPPSGIRRFFDIANEVKADDMISLSIGEPDFATPWHIREKGISSLEQGKTWYSANAGLLELREAIARRIVRHTGVEYDPRAEVVVTVGGSEALDIGIRALVNPGDEVLVPSPSFVCYAPLVSMAGGTPVSIVTKAENGFRLTAEELRVALTPRTKLLILPFPNNPTGAVMRREHLEALAEVLRDTDVMVISDEIYGALTYGDAPHVSAVQIDGLRERTLLVDGFSKAYAMTGWRLGYICGPAAVMKQVVKLHQYAIMCAPTTAQHAAVEAMENGDDDVAEMRAEYDTRRRLILNELNGMGLTCFEPEGAFYVFPSIQVSGLSSEEFCEQLLHRHHVAIVPGTAFGEGGEGFARISYCYSLSHIKEAMKRIRKFLQELKEEQA